MRTILIYICAAFIFIGCTSRTKYKKPDNLIQKEKMVAIWTDIFLGTSAKSVKTIALKKYKNLMPLILKKHHIDSLQFVSSHLYYTSNIDEYEKMFIKIEQNIDDLNRKYTKQSLLDSVLDREERSIQVD